MSQSKVKVKYLREQHLAQTPIDHILQKLSRMELPAKEHFERYMRHKWRLNHKPQDPPEFLYVRHALSRLLWKVGQERYRGD